MSTKKKQPKNYVVKDRYFFEAKRLGYRARSAFKLLEIQDSYSLIRPGMSVLDLASAPGSFLQVLSKAVGPSGTVIGMDIQKMEALWNQNVRIFQGDVFDKEGVGAGVSKALDWFEARKAQAAEEGSVEGKENVTNRNLQQDGSGRSPPLFDLMTSDIAPSTTGITGVDQYRSIELNVAVLEIADAFLKKDGNLVLKVFIGEDIDELVRAIKTRFLKLSRFKPKACRDRSFEEYFVCLGKK